MPLVVLSDKDVRGLLGGLTHGDLKDLQNALKSALHEYSTGTQDDDACASNQPMRTFTQNSNGTTTLFMPSTSSRGIGVKVVTLHSPSAGPEESSPAAQPPDTTPHGSLTVMSPTGHPLGFLNAESLTAFRTALASTLLLQHRHTVRVIVVFGAGAQAYWHARLSLLLRGPTVRHVYLINRSFSARARATLQALLAVPPAAKQAEGWAAAKLAMLTPGYGEYARLLKEHLRAADVIYCTTPSTAPLFDHAILTSHEGRRRGRLLVAIGSYKPHMCELPPELLRQAVKKPQGGGGGSSSSGGGGGGGGHHYHKHAVEGGVVVVDSLTACLREAGEVIRAGLTPQQLVEVGELVMLSATATGAASADSGAETLPLRSPQSPAEQAVAGDDASATRTPSKLSLDRSGSSSMASIMREDSGSSGGGGGGGGSSHRSHSHSRAGSITSMAGIFSSHRRSSSVGSRREEKRKKEDAMKKWLSEGNVIYKSVGMGLMDLVIGSEVVRLAREKGVGVHVDVF